MDGRSQDAMYRQRYPLLRLCRPVPEHVNRVVLTDPLERPFVRRLRALTEVPKLHECGCCALFCLPRIVPKSLLICAQSVAFFGLFRYRGRPWDPWRYCERGDRAR